MVGLRAFQVRRAGDIRAEWMSAEAERTGAAAAVIFHPILQAQAEQIWTGAGGWMRTGCTACGSAEIFIIVDDPPSQRCTESFLKNLPPEAIRTEPGRGGMNRLADFIRRNAFLLAALVIAGAAALVYFLLILGQTGGRFIYNLDDAYIHLAIAKHIARDGVYGVTPFGFSSSSSSILWPLLLAGALKLFGDREILPLLLNLAIAGILIAVLYREWAGGGKNPRWAFGMLIGWLVFLPFGPILFNGMETMLQALTAVAFSAVAVRFLSGDGKSSLLSLCLLAGLCAAVRYEGCFVAAAVCLLMVIRGRWKAAVLIGFSAALPVVLFGAFSLSQGWSFLPNSLLIKHSGVAWTDPVSIWNMAARPFLPVTDTDSIHLPVWQSLAVVLLGMLLLRARSDGRISIWDARVLPAILFLLVAVMHSMWITTEMFFRYQAYLNAWGSGPSAAWARRRWSGKYSGATPPRPRREFPPPS